MRFDPPLVPAVLTRRYKRFLADAVLGDGTAMTASCPNTGSMAGLTAPGSRIWLSVADGTSRRYRHRLELVEAEGTLVGINTAMPNRLAREAIDAGLVPALSGYACVKAEQRYGTNSRVDFLLEDPEKGRAYVEVKNVHFRRRPGLAEFPDSVTARGARHLDELARVVEQGHRGVMLYCIQRGDCDRLAFCRDLDPAYCEAFDRARAAGVEAYAFKCQISEREIVPDRLVSIDYPTQDADPATAAAP